MTVFRHLVPGALLALCALTLGASEALAGCDLEATATAPEDDTLDGGRAIDWRVHYRNVGDAPCKGTTIVLNRKPGRGGASVVVGGSGGRQRLDALEPGQSQALTFPERRPPTSGEYVYVFRTASPHSDDDNRNHVVERRVRFERGSKDADADDARTASDPAARQEAMREELAARNAAREEALRKAQEEAEKRREEAAAERAEALRKRQEEAEKAAAAREQAAAEARAEREEREKAAAEAREKAAAEARARSAEEAEARAKAEAEAESRAAEAAKAREEAARQQAEAEAEARAKEEAETQARAAEAAKAREEAARRQAEAEAKRRAEEEDAPPQLDPDRRREQAREQTQPAPGSDDTASACELVATWVAPVGDALPQGQAVQWQIEFRNTGGEACGQSSTSIERFTGTSTSGSPVVVGGSGGKRTLPALEPGDSTTLTYSQNATPSGGTFTYRLDYFPGINDGDLENHQLQRVVEYGDAASLPSVPVVGQCDLRVQLMQPTAQQLEGGADHTWEIFFRNDGNAPCAANQVYLVRTRQDGGTFVPPVVVGGQGNQASLSALDGGSDVLVQIEEDDTPPAGTWTYQLAYATPHSDADSQNHLLVRTIVYEGSEDGGFQALDAATGTLTVDIQQTQVPGVEGANVCLFSDSARTQQIGSTQQTAANGETTFTGVPAGTVYVRATKEQVVNGSLQRAGRNDDVVVGDGTDTTLPMALFATTFQDTCPAAPPPPPEEEPPPDLGEPEVPALWPTPPDVSFPQVVMPIGSRVCQTVQFQLAPNRDTGETIGLFVRKNEPLSQGGIDVGWTDPTSVSATGPTAANDLRGPVEVLRDASGQVSISPEGEVVSPFQFCAEDWTGAQVGTYTVFYSVADRDVDAYEPQSYFRQGTFTVQVVEAGGAPQPPPDDGPPPVDTATWDAIEPAFKAASCVNCHSAAAGNFASLSSQHSGTNAAVMNPGACTGCHSDSLLPHGLAQVTHPISWQAPSSAMDFRNRSDAQLCQMAGNPGSIASDTLDHLKGDPLILWAVQGGPLPLNQGNAPSAFTGGVSAWNAAVEAWVAAGKPCPTQ